MLLARVLRLITRLRRIQPHLGRAHAFVIRRSRGRIRRSIFFAGGQPVLTITTTGRRSGRPRTTTVAYVRDGKGYAVEGLNLGSDHDPAWCLNLRVDPHAWVEVAGNRVAVLAREASGEEAELLWGRFFEQQGLIRHFRRIAAREVPMFVLQPVASETSA
jgi:deazaflavin-dependent oxidoreductase (nitroreductase family)